MKYGSVCSGIEAATAAWHPLGWQPAWFSEIEPFPSHVLAHHYPQVPNLGDMTKLLTNKTFIDEPIELLVGGTPCQSFSIAGLRGGLDDNRGNLSLEYCRLLVAKQPRWFVWENVPGVFSSNNGEDFACILSAFTGTEVKPQKIGTTGVIAGPFYSVAWRVLDAQYFGVPQRRRRVFVVGHIGNDWRPPFAVLFERDSLRRDFTPSREKGKEVTGAVEAGSDVAGTAGSSGAGLERSAGNENELDFLVMEKPAQFRMLGFGDYEEDNVAGTFLKRDHKDHKDHKDLVTQAVTYCLQTSQTGANGEEVSPTLSKNDKHTVVYDTTQITSPANNSNPQENDPCHTLAKGAHVPLLVLPINTMTCEGRPSDNGRMGLGIGEEGDPQNTLSKNHHHAVAYNTIVRRLTPLEVERLQGFPDNYTKIVGAKDSPRYAACGNSMAVPVMAWIGQRIDKVDKLLSKILKSKT